MTAGERALAIAQSCELFHDGHGESFARITVQQHVETWAVRSSEFRAWIQRGFYEQTGKALAASTLTDVLGVVESKARFDSPELPVHLRVARHGESIYIDLCDADWRAVRVSAEGWSIDPTPPVIFRRYRAMRALPVPVEGGTLDALRPYVRVRSDADWKLVLAWLVTALVPGIAHCILYLFGEQGAAKSSAQRCLVALVDPADPAIRRKPRDEEEYAHAAAHVWVLSIDNVSSIPEWLSDALCRGVTGDGGVSRRLYTDDDDVVRSYRFVAALNGIPSAAERGDLLDRALLIELEPFKSSQDAARRPESVIEAELAALRPRLLGALLTALSGAIRAAPSVKVQGLPRMADFGVWGIATEMAMGWAPGSFMSAYNENRGDAGDAAIEAEPVAVVLLDFMKDQSEGWSGTPTSLLSELRSHAEDMEVDVRAVTWPKSTKGLANTLKRSAPNLRRRGWSVENGKENGERRTYVRPVPAAAASSADPPPSPHDVPCLRCGSPIPPSRTSCAPCAIADGDAFEFRS